MVESSYMSKLGWISSSLLAVGLVSGLLVSCAETADDTPQPPREATPAGEESAETSTVVSAQDQSDGRWIAGGGGGFVSSVSAEGETDAVVASVTNRGAGVAHSALGDNGWLVTGSGGQTQLIDEQGTPQSEPRIAIGGNEIHFVSSRGVSWIAGGANGRVQRLNVDGQPTSDEETLFGGSTASAAASNQSSHWVVGSVDGQLARLSHSDLQFSSSATLDGEPRIVEIVFSSSQDVWLVFTPGGFATFSTGAGASSVTDFGVSSSVTTATIANSTVAIGREDGRVGLASPGSLGSVSWTNALQGNAVRDIAYNGDNWLVVGDSGRAVRIDDSGSVVGSVTTLGGGRALTAARATSSGWMLGIDSLSVYQIVGTDLSSTVAGENLLDGATVHAVVPGPEATLIAGDGGRYRLLNGDGSPAGSVQTVAELGAIETGAWNGRNFFVGDDTGQILRIGSDGSLTDDEPLSVLDGKGIVEMAYTGDFWLVAAADGTVRRLRPSGTPYQSATSLDIDSINSVAFNGDYWLLVGTYQGTAGFMGFDPQGNVAVEPAEISELSELTAVEWGGREWLVGGPDGTAFRIGQSGSVIRQGDESGPRDVLYDSTIRTIDFDGTNYIIGGDNGLVRRLQFSTEPFGPAKVIHDYNPIEAIDWTVPRGFPGGRCVSSDSCLQGSCLGTISDGVCCDEPCEGPCVSCFESETGEPSGTCASVSQGEEPPPRKQDQGVDCVQEAEDTCGQTGVCDGEGNCALYGTDVQCSSKTCGSTPDGPGVTEAGFCDGEGTCVSGEPTLCEPYAGCRESEPACINSCSADEDCADDFICNDMGECVDSATANGNGNGSGDSNGGCTTAGAASWPAGVAVALFCLVGILRRRSHRRV